ncbi:MAG: hypothetical protein J5875_03410 [Paludibacteraceae bacterium]|nr:hypothetical protein [Paludibacteraceae bacterium]
MRQQMVRWRRFSGSTLGVFRSLHKEVTVGVLSLAMLASFDVKAQSHESEPAERHNEPSADDLEEAVMDSVEIDQNLTPQIESKEAGKPSSVIYGKLTDREGRCIHYHSVLDVIANKCAKCRKFYSCYKCHNEKEDHDFGPVPADEASSVMCGVCGHQFSYSEYEQMGGACEKCGARFNPRCSLHKCIYSEKSKVKSIQNKQEKEPARD